MKISRGGKILALAGVLACCMVPGQNAAADTSLDWWSWSGADEDEPGYAANGDVMAYAEVNRVYVVVGSGCDSANYYILSKDEKVPVVGDLAVMLKLVSAYQYGDVVGQGTNVTLSATDLRVLEVGQVKVALVHAQVYSEFGYDMRTANPVAYVGGKVVNTKPFTAADKKLLPRYFEAIGLASENGSGKYLDKYLDELALTRPVEAVKMWNAFSLKVGETDQNHDGIPDGRQLYLMFGPDGSLAASTPWTSVVAARTVTPGGEGLTWLQEYDGGYYPTDPWNQYTLGICWITDRGEVRINDRELHIYRLKGNNKYADFDNDGLSNYSEYIITKCNDRTLNVDNMFSYHGSMTIPSLAGQDFPDYFLPSARRNARASDLMGHAVYDYLGFDYTSHDFIESWWKVQYDSSAVDRTRFEPYDDPDGDGWSNWAECRARTNPSRSARIGADGYIIPEYPVPSIAVRATFTCETCVAAPIVVKCWRDGVGLSREPDAVWIIGAGESGIGLTQQGKYYLADGVDLTLRNANDGHIREGLNTFVCFVDADGDGEYTTGELIGAVRGVDIGWCKAKVSCRMTVELSGMSWREWVNENVPMASYESGRGNGEINVVVRYFGSEGIEGNRLSNVIVEAFDGPDFTGKPAASCKFSESTERVNTLTSSKQTVRLAGLKSGDWYVRAFVDRNGNGVKDSWETWGYANKIGTGESDLYTPVACKVEGRQTTFPTAVVYMEDMDVNNNGVPDSCEEDFGADTRVVPMINGDPGATVTGDAEAGFIVSPSEGKTAVEVVIPQGVDAAKVTVEVSPKVESVKLNGAKVKIVSGGADITEFLDIPGTTRGNDGGVVATHPDDVIDLSKATVKDEIVKEAMDPAKGAKIELDATSPSLTTPNTRKGLFYQLHEGTTIGGMADGDSTIGDGQPWTPKITVKGGDSAFYSIGVGKDE